MSLLWVLGDRETAEQVVGAHDAAVDAAIGCLQRAAGFTRRRAGGADAVEVDRFIGAAFRHRTSRVDDPWLHTHVVANLARTCDDRIYRGLETDGKGRGVCRTDGRTCPVDGCTPDLHDGLSAKSVRNVHGCLHVALEAAVARGYLPRNVADLANPPKARRARSRNARDHCCDPRTTRRLPRPQPR